MSNEIEDVQQFLLVFDHKTEMLLESREFGQDSDAALVAYSEYEQKFADEEHVEVVLIGSDSLETVKVTHANYFGDRRTALQRLAALA